MILEMVSLIWYRLLKAIWSQHWFKECLVGQRFQPMFLPTTCTLHTSLSTGFLDTLLALGDFGYCNRGKRRQFQGKLGRETCDRAAHEASCRQGLERSVRDPWELEDQGEIIGIALWHCSLQTFPNDRIHYIDNFQANNAWFHRGVGVYYGALVHSLFLSCERQCWRFVFW